MKGTIYTALLCSVSLFNLSGCEGGGIDGGVSGNDKSKDDPKVVVKLVPLKISLTDLNDKSIDYIDVSKVGSHIWYKLKLFNPNKVAIQTPALYSDFNWFFTKKKDLGISDDDYNHDYSPVLWFDNQKTTNVDDCFNMQNISVGGSCAYYANFSNHGDNFNKTLSEFAFPLGYTLITPDYQSTLKVSQCTVHGDYPSFKYYCSNASKPEYANQFIKYKINSVAAGTTNIPYVRGDRTTAEAFSYDGTEYYTCKGDNCLIYSVNYDAEKNSLIQTKDPKERIVISKVGFSVDIYPMYFDDGKEHNPAWIEDRRDMHNIHLYNVKTKQWFKEFNDNPKREVPDINDVDLDPRPGISGVDGSFWWNTHNGADVYNEAENRFIKTNIQYVGGVSFDGTVVGPKNRNDPKYYDLVCFRQKDPTNFKSYETTVIKNSALLKDGPHYISIPNKGVYIEQVIPDMVDSEGNKSLQMAWFRVHTENGLCEIHYDDYTLSHFYIFDTKKYSVSTSSWGNITKPENYAVMPISNKYFGL